MEKFITYFIYNFTLTFLILGFIFSVVSLIIKKQSLTKKHIIEALFSYYFLFNIGISFLYNFIMHVFFSAKSASFIGWENSPFQLEVGFASLGFAVIGFIAFKSNISFRTAGIIGPACFLWGAAGGHIYQMITEHNFNPGNAGIIFWSDVFLPIIGFILLYQQYKIEKISKIRK
tara:strand:- start:540 stop:1061 length:522 start_codon:yes stop_codon:yes gene_type:complete